MAANAGWIAIVAAMMISTLGALAEPPRAQADDGSPSMQVVDLPVEGKQVVRALRLTPPEPRGTLVMLPGGSGELGIGPDGSVRHGANFLVRTRAAWLARGYGVVIPDAIGAGSQRGQRSSAGFARAVRSLIVFASSRVPGPVWLIGTSQGSIAAVNGAAHAAPDTLAGVVLTESVSRLGGSGETVFDADPGAVRVPVLLLANRDDACPVAPPDDVTAIKASLRQAKDVTIQTVTGGSDRSGQPCGSLSPHGYAGIEPEVIGIVADWLDVHRGTR